MDWPDVVTDGLPPRRDNEPATLRSDIADELADHLACAMTRELRRADDESAARRAVLDRFGNPQAVARRLWWDAMKETIMRDRILIVSMLVTILVLVGGAMLTWRAVQQGQQVNQALLAKLEALSVTPARREVPENWSKLQVRLVEDSKDGPPVAKASVTLKGRPFTDANEDNLNEFTNEQGTVTFGPVRPGHYALGVTSSVGLFLERVVDLYPGQVLERTFVCPGRAVQAEIGFRGTGVPDWLPKGSVVRCSFVLDQGGVTVDRSEWSSHAREVILNPPSAVVKELRQAVYPEASPSRPGEPPARSRRYFTFSDSLPTAGMPTWPAANYHLRDLSVYCPVPSPDRTKPSDLFWVEVAGYRFPVQPTFEAKAGTPTVWIIELPKECLREVHRAMPADISFRIKGLPDWLELNSILECGFSIEQDAPRPGAPVPPVQNQTIWLKPSGEIINTGLDRKSYPPSPGAPRVMVERLRCSSPLETTATVTWQAATPYRLNLLRLWRPAPPPGEEGGKRLSWIVGAHDCRFPGEQSPAFQAETGQPNTWTIELPPSWLEQARQTWTAASPPAGDASSKPAPPR